jgi:hypothetical protein
MRIYYADYNFSEGHIILKEITSDLIKVELVKYRITKENIPDDLFHNTNGEILFKIAQADCDFQTAIARLFDRIKKLPKDKRVYVNEHIQDADYFIKQVYPEYSGERIIE